MEQFLLQLLEESILTLTTSCWCLCLRIDRSELEKEVAELRLQLCKASVHSEVEELKRALEHKEKERLQLSLQVEVGF